jgi:hypothetical protein
MDCPECGKTMKKCKISTNRFAYASVFVDYFCYTCSDKSSKIAVDITEKINFPAFYTKCIVCDELIFTTKRGYAKRDLLLPHVYHIYKTVYESWKDSFVDKISVGNIPDHLYSNGGEHFITDNIKQEGVKYKMHLQFITKSSSDIHDITEEDADIKRSKAWRKAGNIVKHHENIIFVDLNHNHSNCKLKISDHKSWTECFKITLDVNRLTTAFMGSCSALPLTYTESSIYNERGGYDIEHVMMRQRKCIICHAEYDSVDDNVIFDHFTACMAANIDTLRNNVYTEGCLNIIP